MKKYNESSSPFFLLVLTLALSVTCNYAFVVKKHNPVSATAIKDPSSSLLLPPFITNNKRYNNHHDSLSNTRLYMGWGPEPIWSTGKVISNEVACPSETCVTIKVEVPSETANDYKVPGQYVQLRLNDAMENVLFLAIASAPSVSVNDFGEEKKDEGEDSNIFEFLIKKTDNNDWITSSQSGLNVQVSQVLGNGFPYKENFDDIVKYDFPTQNVLLFAVGSGIAPIKAVIESNCCNIGKPGSGGRTARLYYGVQKSDDLCFVSEYQKWEQSGYQVVPVLSQSTDNNDGEWKGRMGYVQNALEEDGVPVPRNSGALLCGMKEMVSSVKDILVKAGVFDGRVLTNF